MTVYNFTGNADDKFRTAYSVEDLKKILSNPFSLQYENLSREGMCRLMGWCFDFTEELKKFIIKFENGEIAEQYSTDIDTLLAALNERDDTVPVMIFDESDPSWGMAEL